MILYAPTPECGTCGTDLTQLQLVGFCPVCRDYPAPNATAIFNWQVEQPGQAKDLLGMHVRDVGITAPAFPLLPLVNEPLTALWSKPEFAPYCQMDFALPLSLRPGGLLLVGLQTPFAGQPYKPREYDALKPDLNAETYALQQLVNQLSVPATYLPVLFHREAPANYIPQVVADASGREFLSSQLRIFQSLLSVAAPSVVLVCDRLAAIFLRNPYWLRWPLRWDELLGTFRDAQTGTPFFFADTLSGTRALDQGSWLRLMWQLRQVLHLPQPEPLPWL